MHLYNCADTIYIYIYILEQIFVKLLCCNTEMLHAHMQLEVLDIYNLPTLRGREVGCDVGV